MKTGQIFAGSPAKLLRQLTAEEAAFLRQSADNYTSLAAEHKCARLFAAAPRVAPEGPGRRGPPARMRVWRPVYTHPHRCTRNLTSPPQD